MKKIVMFIALIVWCAVFSASGAERDTAPVYVALSGNGYILNNMDGAGLTKNGLVKWTDNGTQAAVFFWLNHSGKLKISLKAKTESGVSKLKVTALNKSFDVKISGSEWQVVPVGTVKVTEPGYVSVLIEGIKKEGKVYADVSDVVLEGPAATEPMNFVRDFSDYWGRRGPSVHLKYTLPQEDVEYFYTEVTVPANMDVIGSYFMATGFGEGYFGMQVNSENQRRILFSVWSPFDTQDPKQIPEEDRVVLMRQGEGVHVGEFGNEGSGGQSYLVYPWDSDVTYRFLAQVRPDGKGNTVYTGYFYAADESRWRLIASFKRPKTDTWYKGAHSFLENFIPENGCLTRSGFYSNQWARTAKGEWVEVTEATFTYDNTAAKQVRLDYNGGESKGAFYLQNGGFFNKHADYGSVFKRAAKGNKPKVNLKFLEELPSVK